MTADTIHRLTDAFPTPEGRLIADFLGLLSPDAAAGEYPIRGREIFALISRYESRGRADAHPEAHRTYADIQILLAGEERIEWFPLDGLDPRGEFDEARDLGFFERPDAPDAIVRLTPGVFAAFMPSDAHMPGLHAAHASPGPVTKVVVKVLPSLLMR
jgi:YhcH/YjgK/YiaL family protein